MGGWKLSSDLDELVARVKAGKAQNEVVSIAFEGNIVDVWEKFDEADVYVDFGSDQTSLHNPWAGGYYPAGISFEEANKMMAEAPELFKEKVRNHFVDKQKPSTNTQHKGTYFFDYGNAFLLEASRAGADVMDEDGIRF